MDGVLLLDKEYDLVYTHLSLKTYMKPFIPVAFQIGPIYRGDVIKIKAFYKKCLGRNVNHYLNTLLMLFGLQKY